MPNQFIRPDTVAQTTAYSPAVRAGNTVYLSGQIPRDREGNLVGRGDVRAQAEQVYTNLKAVVEAAGGTLADIVRLTTYTTSLAYTPIIGEVRRQYWTTDPPASTLLVVASLAMPEYFVEVEGIAVLRG